MGRRLIYISAFLIWASNGLEMYNTPLNIARMGKGPYNNKIHVQN